MKTHIKLTLVNAFLFFGLSFSAFAQDEYNYATINYSASGLEIGVSENGKEFRSIKVPKENFISILNTTPALNEVKKMTDDGWELVDTESIVGFYSFFLRKKAD